jgi:hypothetical protein
MSNKTARVKLREKLNEILKPFNIKLSAETIEMKVVGKLSDGSEIYTPADAFAMDSEVFVMDADGNQMPAPDGEHIIDGTLKIVVSGGKITEAETIEEEAELSAEVTEVINDLAGRIKALEEASTASATELADVKSKLTSAETENTELKAKVAKLSKQPAVASVKKTTSTELSKDKPAKSWAAMTMMERIENPDANPRRVKN